MKRSLAKLYNPLVYISAICLYLQANQSLVAQVTIKGQVKDAQNSGVGQANILLLRASDSVMQKGTITANNGSYIFERIPDGQYLIRASATGFEDLFSSSITIAGNDVDAGSLQLTKVTVVMGAVTVTARKPLFEQKIDRMIINVRNSITAAGGTALEVLERSPGVQVDRMNNVLSLSGKNGVVVMINGKVSNMPLNAVVQMLSGMSASNIEKIELITTPPANFDAEGNAGFINIVLVNNPNKGLNGSYSVTAGYGRREAPAASLNFNFRKNKVNLFGNYSFSRFHMIAIATNYRKVTNNLQQVKESSSQTDRNSVQQNFDGRMGLDYEFSKKTVGGILVAAYHNTWSMDALNVLHKSTNAVADTTVRIPNEEINRWKHYMVNLNLQHTIAEDESLNFDLNYLRYYNRNPTTYLNQYYDANNAFIYDEHTRSGKSTPIRILVGSSDYKRKWGKKTNMEAGVKMASFRFTNNVYVETLVQDTWVPDDLLTANYALEEDIAAAYSSFSFDFTEKTSMKLGLRYEYTRTDLSTQTKAGIVDRKYGRLFPTFYLSRKINENNSVNFSYSRRINRPKLSDLAPFLIFIDPNTFLSGNVNLKPAITDQVKLDYTFKRNFFSLIYSYEKDPIAPFQTSVDVNTNKQYMQAQNLESSEMLVLVVSVPITVNKWWSMSNNLNGVWQRVKVDLGQNPLTLTMPFVGFSSSQNFTLPRNYSAELSGFFRSPGLFGMYETKAFGRFDIGLQKKFKDNSNLRFAVQDLFTSMKFKVVADRPEQSYYVRSLFDFSQRVFRLTYTRNFGNKELKDKRNRGTGSEEELRRVNSNN